LALSYPLNNPHCSWYNYSMGSFPLMNWAIVIPGAEYWPLRDHYYLPDEHAPPDLQFLHTITMCGMVWQVLEWDLLARWTELRPLKVASS
jgi:hypothetical protein